MAEEEQHIKTGHATEDALPASGLPPRKSDANKDKIRLKLILASGKTHEFYFTSETTASEISKHVYENWPEHWDERPSSHQILRLIFQGRFLHGNLSLGALKVPVGKLTVMHLVPRERLPEPPSQGEVEREKTSEGGCRNCCTIL